MITRIIAMCFIAVLVGCTPKVTEELVEEVVVDNREVTQDAENLSRRDVEVVKKKGVPVMKFDKKKHDFGEMKRGEKPTTVFEFTNDGDVDLIIEIASGCSCTSLEYPKNKPIAPGEKGQIKVLFDSNEKEGDDPVTIDILLKNIDPSTGNPIVESLEFTFKIIDIKN